MPRAEITLVSLAFLSVSYFLFLACFYRYISSFLGRYLYFYLYLDALLVSEYSSQAFVSLLHSTIFHFCKKKDGTRIPKQRKHVN